jgi:hypothetical protein
MAVVPPNPGRFGDDTAYERLVLSQLSDVAKIALGQGSATLDIRGPNNLVAIGVHQVVGAGAVQDALRPMEPLAFGAAYKILDLLVELVMDLNGPVTGRRTMKEKQAFARSPIRGPLPSPLGTARQAWERLARLYDKWLEMRHSLVHRRTVLRGDGTLERLDSAGSVLEQLPTDPQQHFIAAVHIVSEAVINVSWSPRRANTAEWHLDQLARYHGMPLFGAHFRAETVPRVIANIEQISGRRFQIDRKTVEARGRAAFKDAHDLDLELHASVAGADETYLVPLEELPSGDLPEIDLSDPLWNARKVN